MMTMTVDDLNPEQLRALATKAMGFRDYLDRLHARMKERGFPMTDPLLLATTRAWEATSELGVVASTMATQKTKPAEPLFPSDGRTWMGE